MAELSLRRFQWFAHVAEQRRVRSTEIMPLVQFRAHRGLQGSHIGGHIVCFCNVWAASVDLATMNV